MSIVFCILASLPSLILIVMVIYNINNIYPKFKPGDVIIRYDLEEFEIGNGLNPLKILKVGHYKYQVQYPSGNTENYSFIYIDRNYLLKED